MHLKLIVKYLHTGNESDFKKASEVAVCLVWQAKSIMGSNPAAMELITIGHITASKEWLTIVIKDP